MSALSKDECQSPPACLGLAAEDPMSVELMSNRELNQIDAMARLDHARLSDSAAGDLMLVRLRQIVGC
jgi:hypothetical protein